MQLSLLSTLPRSHPAAVAARPKSTEVAALSQLDRIAASSARSPSDGLGGAALLVAVVGGILLLGSASLWRAPVAAVKAPPAPVQAMVPTPVPIVAAAPVMAVVPAAEAAVPAAPAPSVQESAPEPVSAVAAAAQAVDAAAEDAARKARARQATEARKKAAQLLLAQERSLAEEAQRQEQLQLREAERTRQVAEEARQRAAAEQARVAPQRVLDARRNVRETCSASGSFLSEQLCRARECSKSEHHGDATCVRLRDSDETQRRASLDR